MSQPPKVPTPPRVNQPPPAAAPQQVQPERKGCLDYFLSCFLIFVLGLLLLVILTVLGGFVLEKLELRDDFFRAVEQRSGLKMPEKLKADPQEQPAEEPMEQPVGQPTERPPQKPEPADEKPEGENPFIIE